jgi:hypothetical protein
VNENSLIKDIGRSYILSSMLPAAFFLSIALILYRALIPEVFAIPIIQDQLSIGLWILFSTLIMWVGFALYSMVNWTVRFYEGYYLFNWVKRSLIYLVFRREYKKRTQYINEVRNANKNHPPDWQTVVDKNYDRAWSDYSDAELSIPLREPDLMPTRLGNVLRASEQYAEKYGLTAGIDLWSRLAALLPVNMANQLEDKNNNLIFLLNSSLLSYINGLIAFSIWGTCKIVNTCSTTIITSLNPMFGIKNASSCLILGFTPTKFLFMGFGWILLGYILYILSIPVAKTYGLLVRASFDLYRFDLLKQLNYPVPTTLTQEKRDWLKISDFMVTGGNLGTIPLEFNYNLREEYLKEKPQKMEIKYGKKSPKKGKR